MSTRLDNEFTVPVPVGHAWSVLLDVERVAPCMPGASLESVEEDTITGRVKVKVGPVTVTYRGTAKFVEKDETGHTVVVEASGKEARGTGTAQAKVRATLHDEGESTRVEVNTDLNVTGRVAQFGRGVMADVSAKLVDKFADNLAEELQRTDGESDRAEAPAAAEGGTEGEAAPSGEDTAAEPSGPEERPSSAPARRRPEDDAIDLVNVAGVPVVKRTAAAVGAAIAGFFLLRWMRRLFRGKSKKK